MASKWIHYTPSVNALRSPWIYNAGEASERTQQAGCLRGVLTETSIYQTNLLQKANPGQIIACNPIIHLSRYNVLFCTHCRSAIPAGQLRSHLVVSHQLPASIREPIIQELHLLPVVQTPETLLPLADDSPPLSCLPDPVRGYRCPSCHCYKTSNFGALRKHLNKEHKVFHDKTVTESSTACYLQRWIQTSRGTWWIVNPAAVPVKVQGFERSTISNESDGEPNLSDEELAVMRMEAEEERRLAQEESESAAQEFELEHDENTEWLRTSEWPQWFRNRPLHVIVAASKTPSVQDSAYTLGHWAGEELISPAAQEAVLRRLTSLTEHVLQRCEETLQSTPRSLRCWVKSSTASVFPRPFETVQKSKTRKRYYQYWNRFLCYVFRVHLISRAHRIKTEEVFGLQLSRIQTQMVDFVYTAAAGLNSQDTGAFTVLAENLFQLFAMFWTDISKDGKMETCALVHFTGVLGIHPRELAYQTAYGFTPTLSAMAWIGRLLLLEYALPLEAYSHLKIPWPSRTQYPDQVQRLRDQIHSKYMRKGCFSPLGYICERIHHARTIATREGPRTNISWSADLQVLSIAGQEISMSGLRQAAHLAVARTEQRARKLMLGLWPNVDLSKIKDSLVTHRPGHSFLSEAENQLQMSFKLLSRRAFSKDGGFSLKGPGRKRAIQYLKDRDELVKHMFGAIHIPSGMPARGEELRVIRWADTVAAPRNIFVLQGRIVLVFSYNKATTVSNKSFYIVRFPCPIMNQVLFVYLTYIRPFSDFLARQLQVTLAMSTNPHLFALHDTAAGCFSSNACLKSLQLSTQGCGFQLTMKLYRHTAISVVKKHIPAIIASFDPNAPSEYAMFLKTLAFQTGHTIQTHSQSYALDNAYPAKLQSDLIDRYYQSSLLWHRFLLLGEGDPLLLQSEGEELDNQSSQAIGYSPDLHLVPEDDEPESIEIEVEAQAQIAVQAANDEEDTQGKRSLVRKRKQVAISEDTTEEFDYDYAPVNRRVVQRKKKSKLAKNEGGVVLEKLMEMQEELSRMISTYQRRTGNL